MPHSTCAAVAEGLPGDHGLAHSRRERRVLVGHGHDLRRGPTQGLVLDGDFLKEGELGARGEPQPLDAIELQGSHQRLSRLLGGHGVRRTHNSQHIGMSLVRGRGAAPPGAVRCSARSLAAHSLPPRPPAYVLAAPRTFGSAVRCVQYAAADRIAALAPFGRETPMLEGGVFCRRPVAKWGWSVLPKASRQVGVECSAEGQSPSGGGVFCRRPVAKWGWVFCEGVARRGVIRHSLLQSRRLPKRG